MWGTATVRGEEDVIVRRLDKDTELCWKTDGPIEGHTHHADDDICDFIAQDWGWLERHFLKNPEGEAFWEWASRSKDPYYQISLSLTWSSWGLGLDYERQYGSSWHEDWWMLTGSLGPFHVTLARFWNLK